VSIAPGADRRQRGPDRACDPQGRRTGDKIMRVQIAASLLCLMIVGGSLDSLPDPPAVKPQSNHNNLVSQLDYHASLAAKNQASACLTCPHLQATVFSFGPIFESSGPSHKLAFVRHATDISPPFLPLVRRAPAHEIPKRPILL
jgi:hypothetical protein